MPFLSHPNIHIYTLLIAQIDVAIGSSSNGHTELSECNYTWELHYILHVARKEKQQNKAVLYILIICETDKLGSLVTYYFAIVMYATIRRVWGYNMGALSPYYCPQPFKLYILLRHQTEIIKHLFDLPETIINYTWTSPSLK